MQNLSIFFESMKQQMNALKEKLFAQEGKQAFRLSTFTLTVEQFSEENLSKTAEQELKCV